VGFHQQPRLARVNVWSRDKAPAELAGSLGRGILSVHRSKHKVIAVARILFSK
jgi:hypothetical protein